jgi:hypothetical protein
VNLAERIQSLFFEEPVTGCWIWTGRLDKDGYGRLCFGGKESAAYRVSFELYRGPIPHGFEPDHLCRVRFCINPWHMEPVTHKVNLLRGMSLQAMNARKTECPQGHPYSEENTMLQKVGDAVWRHCKSCRKIKRKRKSHESR